VIVVEKPWYCAVMFAEPGAIAANTSVMLDCETERTITDGSDVDHAAFFVTSSNAPSEFTE